MSAFSYLLPQIRLVPPNGYRLHDAFSLKAAEERIIDRRKSFKLTLRWQVIRNDVVQEERSGDLVWRNGAWENSQFAYFDCADPEPRAWRDPENISYLERSAEADDRVFSNYITEAGYGVFGGDGRRMILVGAAVKFASPTTIKQIADVGHWIESYPIGESDPSAGFDMSIILVNPFQKDTTASIDLAGHPKTTRIKVPRRSVRRLSLAEHCGLAGAAWRGAIFVFGPNRLVAAFATHAGNNPTDILSLQHSEPYRGAEGFEPLTVQIRRRVGLAIFKRRGQGPGP